MSDTSIKITRSDGKTLDIADGSTWMLASSSALTGWGEIVQVVNYDARADGEGAIITGTSVSPATRTVSAFCIPDSNYAANRAYIISFFRAGWSYTVELSHGGVTRFCTGTQSAFTCDVDAVYKPITFTWTIFCEDPYLKGTDIHGYDIASVQPLYGFPWQCSYASDYGTGVFNYARSTTINNTGDVIAKTKVVITAVGGDVVNPSISVDEDHVKVLTTLTVNDELVLDATGSTFQCKLNDINSNYLIEKTSNKRALRLNTGESIMSYDADDGDELIHVRVYMYFRYMGV